jgi:hypothetical protein
MPKPRFSDYDRLIFGLAAEYPRASDVWRRFQEIAQERGWRDIPGERTVKRRVEDFQKLAPEDRREYARFRWPQTMLDNVLPWEASRSGLDLLRHYDEQDRANDAWAATQGLGPRVEGEGWGRPSVRAVRWLWWVRLAAPSLDVRAAIRIAGYFYAAERDAAWGLERDPAAMAAMEWALAYQPWRSAADRDAARERVPEKGLAFIELDGREFLEWLIEWEKTHG